VTERTIHENTRHFEKGS